MGTELSELAQAYISQLEKRGAELLALNKQQVAELERLHEQLGYALNERDDLVAKLDAAQAELHELRINQGQGWQPVDGDSLVHAGNYAGFPRRLEMRNGRFLAMNDGEKTLGIIILPDDIRLCRRPT